MKGSEDSQKPGSDDALEARIVAWVLGEASPFEAAELEKLCAEDPKLREFERRMRDLDAILAADAKPGMHASWKLPEGKRQKITDLLGAVPMTAAEQDKKVNRYFARRILLAAAACVAISLVSYPLFSNKRALGRVVMAEAPPEKTVNFMPANAGGGGELDRLRGTVARQEQRVEEKRTELSHLIRRQRVAPVGDSVAQSQPDEQSSRNFASLEQEKIQLEKQIETLLKYDGPQLMSYASGLTLPDNDVSRLLPQYQEAKRDYEALRSSGLADEHPSLVEKGKELQVMEVGLNEATTSLRKSLMAKLEDSERKLAELESGEKDAIKLGLDGREFSDRYSEFENEQKKLEQLKLSLADEEMKAGGGSARTYPSDVAVNDGPVPAAPPVALAPAIIPAEPNVLAKKSEIASQPSDPADLYFQGWLQSRDAERMKSEGRNTEAAAKLADARQNFLRVQEEHPEWKKQMVGGRVAQTDEQLAQLSEARAKSIPDSAPAAGTDLAGFANGGLRSGEGVATRSNLDAIMESPAVESAQELAKKDAPTDAPQNLPAVALEGEDPNVYRFSLQEIVPRKPGEMPILDPTAPQGFTLNYSADTNLAAAGAFLGMPLQQDAASYGLAGSSFGNSDVAAAQRFFGNGKSAGSGDSVAGFVDGYKQSSVGGEAITREFQYPLDYEAPQLPGAIADNLTDQDKDGFVAPGTPTDAAREKGDVAAEGGHTGNVDKVRRSLYLAEGGYNLGKYDDAGRHYEDVLRVDPSNKAARRGLERVAQAKTDYYRAAYDHTRAELLSQVDAAWELQQPGVVAPAQQAAGAPGAGAVVSELAQQELARRQQTAGDAERLAGEAKNARESGDLEKAYKLQTDALGLIPEAPASLGRRAELKQSLAEIAAGLAVDAKTKGKEDSAKEWAGKALQWNPQQKEAKQVLDLEGGDETSAVAEPFSTFSLHVSDASFKLAKAALDRGEQPDPAGIRPEEFYNAFDYGDPAPVAGEPVVCVSEQAAHPILPQRNLVRIGVRTAAAGRGGSTPLNLTLLLDSSGSMEREDRQAAMLRAVDQLSKLLKEGDTITVAGFARTPRLLADRLPGARAGELNTIIAQTPSEGGTNLEEGLKLAEELAKRQFNAAAQNRIVLFTDGAANLGDAQPDSLQARVEQLRQEDIAFDAAGFGAEGLNDRLLERLTRNGNGRYYVVDQAEDAGDGFAKQLAGAFRPAAENVKVQVRFNAARVARYKLIGFEEHRLAKEDFKNDAVDAAEMAAEEAGNALYQIQTLPEGEGEIGEVSVRFRDVASGRMVERTWTIPYEAQAAAFDQASASMKLAGLAMMAAEKLQKGPMAEAVDFSRFGKVVADVKSEFAGSGKVEEFGGMVEKLR